MVDNSLIIRIGAKANEFDKELKRLKGKTASLEKGLAQTAKISAVAFAGLAASVGVAVSKFTSFEKSFTNVQTLLDKSSFATKNLSQGIKDLRNDVLKLGADSGESFDNLNQGLFDLISAGVPAEEATQALTDAVNLATAGATDTATSVKALTAAITAYGEEAGSSTDIAEKFFTAQKFGVTTVGELAKEFNKVGGLAKQLGLSFDEALAASTALTANGAKPTAQAFTEFRAILNAVILAQGKLAGESEAVQKALSLQNIQQKGIVQALKETQIATGGNVVTLQKLLGSSEALSGALSLTGKQAETFQTILKNLNDEQERAAAFSDALATKQATTDKALQRLTKSFEAITIQLGEQFAPLVNQIADGLSEVAKKFNDLSTEQKQSIVDFIKAGVAITGVITGLTTFGLVIIKSVRFLKALRLAFLGARIAAGAFITTATLGLGTILTFIPEIISGVKALTKLFTKGEEPKTLTQINDELDKLKKKQEAIQTSRAPSEYARQRQLEGVEQEIKKLEELRKKKLEVANQESDGSLLLRPEEDDLSDPTSGLQDIDGLKSYEQMKTDAEKAASLERIENTRAENEAKSEIDQEKRDTDLENDALRREEDLALKAERDAEDLERNQAFEAAMSKLSEDERKRFTKVEQDDLKKRVLTKAQVEKQASKDKLVNQINENNQFLKTEQEFGRTIATFDKALNNEQVKGARDTGAQLAQLTNSKNKTLKAIGKRAAQAQIAIDTATGAVSAYKSLAGIPIVGPGLGAAAAAALVAYGAERVATVNAAQRGGIVPNVGGGARDRVPMLLEPNELVVPKGLAPDFIQSVGRPDAQGDEGGEESVPMVEIAIEDDATDFITAKQRENETLGIGVV